MSYEMIHLSIKASTLRKLLKLLARRKSSFRNDILSTSAV